MIAGKLMAACVAASGLWSEGAHAQSAAPDVVVPTISCTTPPAIFNTGINGDITNNASYATASKITPSNGTKYDQHWQMTPQLKPFDPATQTYQTFFNDPASVNWTGKSAPVYYYSTAWLASPFGNAEWIGLNHTPGTSGPYYETSIYYKYTFNLDSAVIPSSFSLKLRGSSDDYFKEVYVNYVPQLNLYPLPENANTGVATFSSTNYANIFLNKNWQAGQNTIIVRIKNQSAPTGFLMQTDGTAACANEVQVKKTTTSTVVKPGDPITFDLAVGNYSTIDRTINLTDQIPQGLTNYSWSCSAVNSIPAATCPVPANGTGAINNLPLTIAAGGTLKFTITTTVGTPAQITTPTITNTATITTPTLPTDTANICTPSTCSASATVKTTPLVNITKTPVAGQNSNHYPGDVVAYNLTVTNMGQIALKNITLSDVHTTNASFVPTTGMTWACLPADNPSPASCPATTSGSITTAGLLSGLNFGLPVGQKMVIKVYSPIDPALDFAFTSQALGNTGSVRAGVTGTDPLNPNANITALCSANASVTTTSALPCTATASINVLPKMKVTLGKTANPANIVRYIGQPIDYTVTVTNTGQNPTTGTLNDVLPAGVTPVVEAGNPSCKIQGPGTPPTPAPVDCPAPASPGTPGDITSGATIPAGGTLTYTLKALATSVPPSGNLVNTAIWTPADIAHTVCSPTTTPACTATVTNPVSEKPILSITNELDKTLNVSPGSTVTYTVKATNTGPAAAPNMFVALSAPDPATGLASITWTCVPPTAPQGIACSEVTFDNTDPNAPIAKLANPVPVGSFVTLKGVAVVSTTLQSDDSVSLKATDGTNPAVHDCHVTTTCEATATFKVTKPELKITNQVLPSSQVAPGSGVTYTVVVSNTSNADAPDARVTAPIPPAEVASISWSCTPSSDPVCAAANLTLAPGSALNAALKNLPANTSVTFTGVAVTASPLTGSTKVDLTATTGTVANVHTCHADSPACTATASFTVIGPQLSITNTVAIDPSKRALVKAGPTLPGVVPGKYVIYTIVATNSGKVDAPNVRVYTDAPANLTFTNWECTGTCPTPTAGTGALDQTIVNLPVNAVATFKVYAQVNASAPNNQDIVLTATDSTSLAGMLQCGAGTFVAAGPAGTPVASCTDTATLNTADAPVLSITNTVTPDKAPAGVKTNLVYKIIVTNTAGSPVTDALIKTGAAPANVTLGDWTCTASDNKSCPAASGGPGPIDVKVASYPVGVTLTFTLKATLEKTAEKGDILPLNATVAPETMLAKCAGNPLTDAPCQKEATVTVTAAVVADGALAVPTNAWWMLLTLASLMLVAAAMVQREALKKKAMQATRR